MNQMWLIKLKLMASLLLLVRHLLLLAWHLLLLESWMDSVLNTPGITRDQRLEMEIR